MKPTHDLARVILVAVTAVAQIVASPLTTLALGPSSNTGAISDANNTPITPAGYAFAIWGLIYLLCLGLAVYQLLPSQRRRPVHRRTGWPLVGAFTCSTIWVPIFGGRLIWLSQIVIISLVIFLVIAARRFTTSGPASTMIERAFLRLPITVYLGWATLATAAGFGLTMRSFGMPAQADWVTGIGLALVGAATVIATIVVLRVNAVAGFVFTSCWALVAVAVATPETIIAIAAVGAIVVLVATLIARTARTRHRREILVG